MGLFSPSPDLVKIIPSAQAKFKRKNFRIFQLRHAGACVGPRTQQDNRWLHGQALAADELK